MVDDEGLAGPPLACHKVACVGQPTTKDPMTTDPNVCVPPTTVVSTNPMDVANLVNPANPAGPTNSTNITSLVDPANPTDPNEQPLLPKVDPPLAPSTKGESGLRIGKPTIGEPHVDLGKDFELARPRDYVGQVGQTKELRIVGCDVFTQQRREFLRDPLQGRLVDRSGRVYTHVDNRQTVQPSSSGMRTDFPLPKDGQILPNRSSGENRQTLVPGGMGG
uniref:Uncharacterized protein n=1 Tax=Cannabis sativa TaxID=3483 RepID=A0A803NY71_CANSA